MPERVEPSPLDNYSAPYSRAHVTSHCIVCHRTSVALHGQCHTHIRIFCSMAMSGRSSCVQALDVLEVPYWAAIVLTLFLFKSCWLPAVYDPKGSFQGNKHFYTLLWCHQALFWCYHVIFQQSDWLKRAQCCHLVGISLFSRAFQYRKVNFVPDSKERGHVFWLSFGLNVSDSPDWFLLASPQDMSSSTS